MVTQLLRIRTLFSHTILLSIMTCNYDASDFLELGLLYHGWDREHIGRNSEQTTTTSMPKKQTPWEIAKPILEKEYLAGRITDQMKPGHVHKLREEFTAVPINTLEITSTR